LYEQAVMRTITEKFSLNNEMVLAHFEIAEKGLN